MVLVGRGYYEVKPTRAEVRRAKYRMAVIWETEPDAVLYVVCGEGCTFFVATRAHGRWEEWVERWRHG